MDIYGEFIYWMILTVRCFLSNKNHFHYLIVKPVHVFGRNISSRTIVICLNAHTCFVSAFFLFTTSIQRSYVCIYKHSLLFMFSDILNECLSTCNDIEKNFLIDFFLIIFIVQTG